MNGDYFKGKEPFAKMVLDIFLDSKLTQEQKVESSKTIIEFEIEWRKGTMPKERVTQFINELKASV